MVSRWPARILDLLPVILPVWIMAIGLSSLFLLVLGRFNDGYLITFGVISFLICTFLLSRYRAPSSDGAESEGHFFESRTFWNVVVLVGILVWAVFNSFFVAQHVITDRDPGVYTNAGIWLMHHNNLLPASVNPFGGGISSIVAGGNGFQLHTVAGHTALYAQGAHLLPVYLGLAGRLWGLTALFHVNVWFGAMALLAIYGLAKRLVKPMWAATITGALAASMPYIYFSRDNYTELLAAAFVFAALCLLDMALKSKRLSLWLLTGLMVGAMCMARIDGYLAIAGFAAFMVVHLVLAKPGARKSALRSAAALSGGMAVTGLVGWLDLQNLSYPYYISTFGQFRDEIMLIVAIALIGYVAVYVSWRKESVLAKIDALTKGWRDTAAAFIVLFVALFLASRPLWMKAREPFGIRSYYELSMEWVSWYLGPIMGLLGVIGAALTASKITKKYDPLLMATFIVFVFTAMIYLVAPNAAPDQIWASRRLVPIILPGVAIFAAIVLNELWQKYFKALKWSILYVPVAMLAIVMGPLITSRPLLIKHDTDLLAPAESICRNLPRNAAVLWAGWAGTFFAQPTRTICDVPSLSYGPPYSKFMPPPAILSQIAQKARSQGYTPILGMSGSDLNFLTAGKPAVLSDIDQYSYGKLQQSFLSPPQALNTISDSLWLGVIQPDGTISTLKN